MPKDTSPPVRDPNNPATAGDNLTEAQIREAVYRTRKKGVTDIMRELEAHDALGRAIRKRLSKARQEFTHDTSILLKDLDIVLQLEQLQRTERSSSLQSINWMAEMEGLAAGGQLSMLDAMNAAREQLPTLTRDTLDWENDGRVAGGKGLPCETPEDCPPNHVQDWTKGWHYAQERLAWSLSASKVIDRDISKDGTQSAPPKADGDPECEVCGGDGSMLAKELVVCPSCNAEYEPEGDDGSRPTDPLLH